MSFSLQLSEEQTELRDWVHGFARDVIRPAAAEWDAVSYTHLTLPTKA